MAQRAGPGTGARDVGRAAVSPDRAEAAAREFHTQGFVALRSVLSAGQARGAPGSRRAAVPGPAHPQHRGPGPGPRRREPHADVRVPPHVPRFPLSIQPVIGVVERILGTDCHVVAQNALRTPTGKGIINWHIDDALFFPFLAHLPAAPAEHTLPLPCYSLNVLVALSDVDDEVFGPTQVVAGSHMTGREPGYTPMLPPGARPTSFLARAGDAYLVNSQTWHRGRAEPLGESSLPADNYLRASFHQPAVLPVSELPDARSRGRRSVASPPPRASGQHEKGPYG